MLSFKDLMGLLWSSVMNHQAIYWDQRLLEKYSNINGDSGIAKACDRSIMGWIISQQNSFIEVLNPSILECDGICS